MTDEKESDSITMKDFIDQSKGVVDKMREAFFVLEKAAEQLDRWTVSRRTQEEEEETCNCVSEVLYEMQDIMQVSMHVLHTYGKMIIEATNKVGQHRDKGSDELKKQVEQTLTNLPDDIKAHLEGLAGDKPKMN